MERQPRSSFVISMGAVLVLLGGCDNKVNNNFEQEMRDRPAAATGDKYAGLAQLNRRLSNYSRMEPDQRRSNTRGEAQAFRPTYEMLLKKLDAEEKIAALDELTASCRATFNEVLAFHSDEITQPPALQSVASALAERLETCRERAIKAQETDDEATQKRAAALRRFSSTGMVIVGMMTAVRGDEATGLKIWGNAEKFAAEDRPGFEFKTRMLVR